jgi:hypothetical protein
MLEVQLKMLAAVNKTNDQLEKVEVAKLKPPGRHTKMKCLSTEPDTPEL